MTGRRQSSRRNKKVEEEKDIVGVEEVESEVEIETENEMHESIDRVLDQKEDEETDENDTTSSTPASESTPKSTSEAESPQEVDTVEVDCSKSNNDSVDVDNDDSISTSIDDKKETSSKNDRKDSIIIENEPINHDEESCEEQDIDPDKKATGTPRGKEQTADNEDENNEDEDKEEKNDSEEEKVEENDENNDEDEAEEDKEEKNDSEEEVEENDENNDEDEDEDDDDDEVEEEWDLKHVHSIEEVESEKIKCMTKNCPLIACTTYVSSLDAEDVWYSCLDCQDQDYGGWPTDLNEIPINFMTIDHRNMITEKCTGRYSPDMPDIPTSDPSDKSSPPLPPQPATTTMEATEANQGAKIKSTTKTISAITPPPGQLQHAQMTSVTKITTSKGAKVTPIPSKPSKPSNQALAVHKKWQDTAKSLGGDRIVVSKPAAKKLIFVLLKDSFRPFNITDIFKRLRGVVPSPVLKSSLDDMALDTFSAENQFADSDDEDDRSSSKKKSKIGSSDDEYAGSLSIKAGRNANTTLYYCDYSSLTNNGNGLLPDDRNTLLSDHETAKAEMQSQDNCIKSMTAEASKLLSEPTNEELTAVLEEMEENATSLREEVESAQELKGFEKHKVKVNKRVDTMAAQWRKRKRVCMDFLVAMEENTEGSISTKKCLSGDGQIYIESDAVAIKGQKEYAINQKRRSSLGKRSRRGGMASKKRHKMGKPSITDNYPPDESFVGVELDTRGSVGRIYVDEEN